MGAGDKTRSFLKAQLPTSATFEAARGHVGQVEEKSTYDILYIVSV